MKQEAHHKSYWAFISYSSKDEAVARRLHRGLEHYRMPRDLVGRPMRDGEPTPKRLFPVFRDRDELPLSADLGNAIESALKASRYLIVLCSPSAATSRWVNEEIRYFKSIGGEERIMAIIVSGEPNASDKAGSAGEECFPPALRFHVDEAGRLTDLRCEPIAGDLRKSGDGWKACVLKALAGITGLGLAAFTKREHVRTRRRRILMAGAAILLIGSATAWWDFTRTKVAYFAHLTEHFGVPTGVMAVVKGELAGRSSTYRVESSRGKVRRVLHVNGSGFPTEDDDAPFQAAIRELVYREDGSLQTIDFRSPQGRVAARREFSSPRETAEGVVIIAETKTEHDGAPLSFDTVDEPVTMADKGKSEASVMRSVYGRDGLPFRTEYLNAYRNPAPDSQGIGGTLLEHCKNGLLVGTVFNYTDSLARPINDGVLTIRTIRDKRGEPIEVSYVGTDGKPTLNASGYSKWTAKYDGHGNLIEGAYFGTDGKPVTLDDGYSKATFKYDERGHLIEGAYFGTHGQRVMLKDGYAKWIAKYDQRGHLIEGAYFGADGKPVTLDDGYSKATFKYDERGHLIEGAYFGTDGKPVLHELGYARVASRFDERGNEIERAHFGTDGKPTLNFVGCATWIAKYDESGNPIEFAYYGTDDNPVLGSAGYAKTTRRFDERGNEIERAHFGTDGKPTLNFVGYAKRSTKFDERGNQIEVAFFGTDGMPISGVGFPAKISMKFDERGNQIETSYFDTEGRVIEE